MTWLDFGSFRPRWLLSSSSRGVFGAHLQAFSFVLVFVCVACLRMAVLHHHWRLPHHHRSYAQSSSLHHHHH
jgi:hypothetical protein